MRSSTTTQTNTLARDVQGVVSDAQELLKTVQEEGGARFAEVRGKVQSQIESARETLGELQETVEQGAKLAVTSTDTYVKTNPWRAVGIGVAVGAIIGYLAGRR